MECVLITGGTGMTGKRLTSALLENGYRVIILTRDPAKHRSVPGGKPAYAAWDIEKGTIDREAIAAADHIIHLAGAGIADKRWTKERKQLIVSSRVEGGKLLVKSLHTIPNKVRTLITASAIGWYGPDQRGAEGNARPFTENDPPDNGFLGETCRLWEQSVEEGRDRNRRVIKFRTGIILSGKGGALEEFRKPLRFRIATIMGSGKQIMSWIHIDDLVRMYLAALKNEKMNGVYNAVSPNPVSNKTFTLTLARERKSWFIPFHVPTFVLKMVLGEMSIEVLKSATVSAEKMMSTGFAHHYPRIEQALAKTEQKANS